jgi:hypothetical protein
MSQRLPARRLLFKAAGWWPTQRPESSTAGASAHQVPRKLLRFTPTQVLREAGSEVPNPDRRGAVPGAPCATGVDVGAFPSLPSRSTTGVEACSHRHHVLAATERASLGRALDERWEGRRALRASVSRPLKRSAVRGARPGRCRRPSLSVREASTSPWATACRRPGRACG